MGCCSAKGAKAGKSDAAAKTQSGAGGSSKQAEEAVVDLLSQAALIARVCGSATESQQNGYVDKELADTFGKPPCRVGYVCKKGLKPESPNQDDFCIYCADTAQIYGVFDGHGPYGHDISNYVQKVLPRSFKSKLFEQDPKQACEQAFEEANKLCWESDNFECELSGTTATMAMLRGGYIYLAHVGDSRAVLAKRPDGEAKFQSEDLTEDHRPALEAEKERIRQKGGEVRLLKGDATERVFMKGKHYPGLTLSRSIGDKHGMTAGVTCKPSFSKCKIEEDWQFVLLCSDGVWEFVSSQEAVEIVGETQPDDAQGAAEKLAKEAWARWIKEEGNVVDDITVILAWL